MFKKILFIIIALPILCFAGDSQLLRTKMLSDLDIIKNTFEVKYAPVEWKKKFANWDLEEKISSAKSQIAANEKITVRDYQQILKNFFNSTRDYHVGISFYSTECSFLPFRVQSANNHYFIVWIDRQQVHLPLSVGDEILTFNGKPIASIIEELKAQELGNPNSKTDQAKAEMYLTTRLGAFGMQVPQGSVDITVKSASTQKTANYQLNWFYLPEEIKNNNVYRAAAVQQQPMMLMQATKSVSVESKALTQNTYFHRPMTAGFYKQWRHAFERKNKSSDIETYADGVQDPLGLRKSFVPQLGQMTWKSSDTDAFYAYLFKTPDQKTIGYVRIPSFMGDEATVRQFSTLIKMFELKTDALVIDQVDNPGGEVFYMYALASILADKPQELPTHRETITQEDVIFALDSLKQFSKYSHKAEKNNNQTQDSDTSISGYPITPELIESLTQNFQFIIQEWNEGHVLTDPHYLFGIQKIQPYAQGHYTKPILVLVNEMSISCGDFFPAMIQDNKRGKVFGARTAGAGGFVLTQTHPNRFGIEEYSFTASFVERKDKNPIENLGVTPDIIYELTPEDLQQNYKGYVTAVQKALKELIKK